MQAAAELSDEFRDGTFFVALAPLRKAHTVRSTVAESIGLQPDDDVVGWLASRRVLLVLDNLEQLAGVATVVAELLVGEVVVLATSRAPLHLSFEREPPVEPLPDGAAAELFVNRAAAGGRHVAVDETVRAVNIDAAEAVAGAELDQLAALLDHSLLKTLRDERFFLLGTLREYARERLDESGETDRYRRGHASWFVALAEEAAPGLTGPDQASCLERLTDDDDNMRAVLDWAADAGEDELLLRLTGASFRFWYLRSLLFGASLIAHRQGDAAARAHIRSRTPQRLPRARRSGADSERVHRCRARRRAGG